MTVRQPAEPLGGVPPRNARRPILLGVALLVLALPLGFLHAMLLMSEEDWNADTDPVARRAWWEGLGPGLRVAYWVAGFGFPIALAAGALLVGVGVWRAVQARRR